MQLFLHLGPVAFIPVCACRYCTPYCSAAKATLVVRIMSGGCVSRITRWRKWRRSCTHSFHQLEWLAASDPVALVLH